MKKKRRLSVFFSTYLFVIAVFVVLSIIFLFIFSALLKDYEVSAEIKRQNEQRQAEAAAQKEEERLQREKELAELAALEKIIERDKRQSELENAAAKGVDAAVDKLKNVTAGSPVITMENYVRELNGSGAGALISLSDKKTGKYESDNAIKRYIESQPGDFTYEMTSPVTADLKKGAITFKITLSERLKDGYVPYYEISLVEFELPYRSYTVTAPENSQITVNGTAADEVPEIITPAIFENVPDVFSPPKEAKYTFDGFLFPPEITATVNGKNCECISDGDKYVFSTEYANSDVYMTELSDRAFELAYIYTDFVAGIYKFNEIKRNVYSNTPLYTSMSGLDNRWYYGYDYLQNENGTITGFKVYSDRLIGVHLKYDQVLYSKTGRIYRTIKMEFDLLIGCPSKPKVPRSGDAEGKYADWVLISVE